ncbi:MAG: alkaline phosphatase family protein [Bdellovibrionia bacterium]
MNKLRFACQQLVLLLIVTIASASPKVGHVVIISIDGGKPDVLRSSQMPTLQGLIGDSSYSWKAHTVFPNVTLPSHTSMLTGVGPNKHKILWNSYIPKNGTVKVATIFGRAKAAGLSTAFFAAKEKFKHLNVQGTLDVFELPSGTPGVSTAAAKYFVEHKPNLLFAHFPEADQVGHKKGWGSNQQKDALKTVDQGIATILAAIAQAELSDDTVVIITADHGGFGWGHGLPIPANYTIPWIAIGKGVAKGQTLPDGIRTTDTAATALWLLDVQAAGLEGRPVMGAFPNL